MPYNIIYGTQYHTILQYDATKHGVREGNKNVWYGST